MTIDELIRYVSLLAVDQHGLVRTDQVPPADGHRLRHLARRGVLERMGKGVYRVNGAPDTWEQRLQAGLWALGPTAVVSHAAAAQLHGFDRFDADSVEFTVDRTCRGRAPAGIESTVHTTTDRRTGDTVRVAELPTTSALRTILDLARGGVATVDLEAAIDSAVRLRLTTLDRIIERLSEVTGGARWGVSQLDALLATSGGHTLLERRFLGLVRRAGLPSPTPQVVHRSSGRHVARADFLFEQHGVVVEVSGGRGHSSPSERAKDARRRNELQQMGRLVLEFTFEQVTQQTTVVIETLCRALDVRGAG